MIIAVSRKTGELYSYRPTSTITIEDFIFGSIEDFIECVTEEGDSADDYILFEVDKLYRPRVVYEEITDGEIYT